MTPAPLDIHAASEAERLEAYRNVHDVWSGGLSLDEHLRKRLASVQHNRARWFVGCLDSRVVSSLALYPLSFHVRGEVVAGIAIGSVHTVAEHRGRGFARQLMAHAERVASQEGAALSVLYSDIDQKYYARLGYQLCPSMHIQGRRHDGAPLGRITMGAASDAILVEVDPQRELPRLMELYETHHRRLALSIARNEDYWRYLLAKNPGDAFFGLLSSARELVACARTASVANTNLVKLRDLALAEDSDAAMGRLLDLLHAELHARRQTLMSGWLPDTPAVRERFQLLPRPDEITMLKSLKSSPPVTNEMLLAAAHFHEIDHV
ncbi:MAG: GNAT family N-acetyltransferase [Planctomycetes bacterium]|nr:GNAT family N-acetyltransferase [Planctomycetota bacterium]